MKRYRGFVRRILERSFQTPGLTLRETLRLRAWLEASEGPEGKLSGNQLNEPWRIVTVDWRGNVHTFSPELIGMHIPEVGTHLGNVHTDTVRSIERSQQFARLKSDIDAGVEKCRTKCAYFEFCGG